MTTAVTGGGPDAGAAADALRFVLFFDAGHLAVDGRGRAFKEARRWIREVKRPTDLVAIYAVSFKAGLREISPFNDDADLLLESLAAAERDPALQEGWPSAHQARWETCRNAGTERPAEYGAVNIAPGGPSLRGAARMGGNDRLETQCRDYLDEELRRSRASLAGLHDLIESLEAIPGRKALILFNQTGALEVGAIYPNVFFKYQLSGLRDLAGDVLRQADQLSAEAILARTTINTAYVGDRLAANPVTEPGEWDLSNGALGEAAVLAESTGGRHNLDLQDLGTLTSSIRSRCACIYRLGLEAPPEGASRRVYQARVTVRGRLLDPLYRVAFLSDLDRWIRAARNVLRNPDRSRDVAFAAALVPVTASAGGWDIAVQLVVDLGSLEFLPVAGGEGRVAGTTASWEAGALLVREGDDADWGMLALSGAKRATGQAPAGGGQWVVHERVLRGVAPGHYHIAAFVKDRTSSLFGGAQASLDLPPPGKPGLTEPVLRLAPKRYLTAPLPVFEKNKAPQVQAASPGKGSVPPLEGGTPRGETLLAETWLCRDRKEADSPPGLTRYVARNGAPIFRLGAPLIEPGGACLRITDTLETAELEPDAYSYHLVWREAPGEKPIVTSAPFVITAAAHAPSGPPEGPAESPPSASEVPDPLPEALAEEP